MSNPRVLSVGQCGFDSHRIDRFLGYAFQAETVRAHSADEAIEVLRNGRFDLVLVNRVFNADDSPGVDFIRAIKADLSLASLPTMLVSNYPQAQAEAVEAGAVRGFGKEDLDTSKARNALASVLRRQPV